MHVRSDLPERKLERSRDRREQEGRRGVGLTDRGTEVCSAAATGSRDASGPRQKAAALPPNAPPPTNAETAKDQGSEIGLPGPAPGDRESTRSVGLLVAGAATGLALAAFGLLETRSADAAFSPDTAAIVGERVIRGVDYQRVLAGVEGDLRNPVDDALRRRVLDRMIDEELLVQRALDLGLAVIDRRVRGELTSGLIDSIVSEVDGDEPSERDVARHYEENTDFFTRPGRLRVRTLFFSDRARARRTPTDTTDTTAPPARASASDRAQEAKGRLRAGEDPAAVERDLADAQVSPPPDTLLPAAKVRDYVGPTILETVMAMEVGAWSEPVASGSGLSVAGLVDREPPVVPPLAQVESLVRQDLKRRRGDEALRRYLTTLRAETPVEINEAVFDRTAHTAHTSEPAATPGATPPR